MTWRALRAPAQRLLPAWASLLASAWAIGKVFKPSTGTFVVTAQRFWGDARLFLGVCAVVSFLSLVAHAAAGPRPRPTPSRLPGRILTVVAGLLLAVLSPFVAFLIPLAAPLMLYGALGYLARPRWLALASMSAVFLVWLLQSDAEGAFWVLGGWGLALGCALIGQAFPAPGNRTPRAAIAQGRGEIGSDAPRP